MLKKILRTKKWVSGFLLCLVLTLLIAGICGYLSKQGKNPLEGAKDYNELIIEETDKAGMYVSVTLSEMPYLIAEDRQSNDKYYILVDQNQLMYIAMMSDKTYNEIEEANKKNPDDFSYTLTGRTYKTTKELKDLIIEMYEEEGYSSINATTFSNYFGSTYLNTEKHKNSGIISVLELVETILVIFTIALFVGSILSIVGIRMALSKVSPDILESELSVTEISKYAKAKIYITPHYLLSTELGLYVVELDKIGWVYITHIRNNRMVRLTIHQKDGRIIQTANCSMRMKDILQNAILELIQKNPNLLVGYSYDNREAYNQMKSKGV